MSEANADFLRLDKWLVFTRFFKTRSRAADIIEGGHIRINGAIIKKPHYKLRLNEVLTFPQGRFVRVVRVRTFPSRRGSAREAQLCYEDLRPTSEQQPFLRRDDMGRRPPGTGRPTKKDRRDIQRLKCPG